MVWNLGCLCNIVEPCVVVFPYGCCYVYPGWGMNYMQDLGVEEMLNGIDKPSEERNLTKI